MRGFSGAWRKTERHFAEVFLGEANHWLRTPTPPRIAALHAASLLIFEGAPEKEEDEKKSAKAARNAQASALYAAAIGFSWGSREGALETPLPSMMDSVLDYGALVWEELADSGATEEQVMAAGGLVFDKIRGASKEEASEHENFSSPPTVGSPTSR